MIETKKDGDILEGLTVQANTEDGMRIRHNNCTIQRCYISNYKAQTGHLDAIQLIPKHQFCGGILESPIIYKNTIKSKENIQGIFSSDGMYRDMAITNNTIDTNHPHKITINGLLSGRISGNKDSKGRNLRVTLNPLRIGGQANIFILSFAKEENLVYEPILSDIPEMIIDNRQKAPISEKVGGILAFDVPLKMIYNEYIKLFPTAKNGVDQANCAVRAFWSIQQRLLFKTIQI